MIAFGGFGLSFVLVSLILSVCTTFTKCEEFEFELEAATGGPHPIWKRDVITGPDGSPMTWEEFEDLTENSKGRRRREVEDVHVKSEVRDPRPASRFYSNSTLEDEAAVGLGRSFGSESIAAGGNAFELAEEPLKSRAVQDEETTLGDSWVAVFFHMSKDQSLAVSLRCRSLDGAVQAVWVCLETEGDMHKIEVTGTDMQEIAVPGEFPAKAGYVQLRVYGNPGKVAFSHIVVNNKEPGNEFTYIKPGFSYYFGRRGPSVHLNIWPKKEVELCYTEIKADPAKTPYGTYYMALGTGGLYFGIQNNEANRRIVIFSVWSEFKPDKLGTGKEIPKDLQIQTLHSIAGAKVDNFGHEGYGTSIQHNLMWDLNKKYRFALKIKNGHRFREVTAWIAPEGGGFLKVGTLKKPTMTTPERWQYVYSFVENYEVNFGHLPRKAFFGNQWCMHPSGKWQEFTKLRHTTDETGNNGVRLDRRAGVGPDSDMFLEMGGFMNDFTPAEVDLTRKPSPPHYLDKLLEELERST